MHTTPQSRIDQFTSQGLWGTETLHGLLAKQAASHPDKLAVADQPNRMELTGEPPRRLSFSELDAASDTLAAALHARGIGIGDKVMVQLPNISELVICYYALSKLGAIISPVPVQYGSHELLSLAEALAPDALISITQFRGNALADQAAKALHDIPILAFGRELSLQPDSIDTTARETLAQVRQELGEDANRIITVCWTSGTTGTPSTRMT